MTLNDRDLPLGIGWGALLCHKPGACLAPGGVIIFAHLRGFG
jgi:hypothetical protein